MSNDISSDIPAVVEYSDARPLDQGVQLNGLQVTGLAKAVGIPSTPPQGDSTGEETLTMASGYTPGPGLGSLDPSFGALNDNMSEDVPLSNLENNPTSGQRAFGSLDPSFGALDGTMSEDLPYYTPGSPFTNEPTGGALGNLEGESVEDLEKIQRIIWDTTEAVLPDAFVKGGTTPKGGAFELTSFATGDVTKFVALPGKDPGTSIVGTIARDEDGNISSEAGLGFAKKFKSPALGNTEGLLFINLRTDSLPNDLEWKMDGSNGLVPDVKEGETVTVSANFGGAYSVSDAAAAGVGAALGSLMGVSPKAGAAGAVEIANAAGSDLWAGAAWRASATFDSEGLVSVKIGDTEIVAEDLEAFIGNNLAKYAETAEAEVDMD